MTPDDEDASLTVLNLDDAPPILGEVWGRCSRTARRRIPTRLKQTRD